MSSIKVTVPDIGDFKDIPVIEVLVKVGDTVAADAALITLESDKATMDVPAPAAGVIRELKVKAGDKVSEGSLILLMESAADQTAPAPKAAPAPNAAPTAPPAAAAPATPAPSVAAAKQSPPAPTAVAPPSSEGGKPPHASPSVRSFARNLGVDVRQVTGSGPKGRILHVDVEAYVKQRLSGAGAPSAAGGGLNLLPWPQTDFSKFGAVERAALSRIKKISGANLARNWVMIPHVTQHDEADITDLEAFRQSINKQQPDAKLTILAFLMKAVVAALKRFPEFNASLDGEELVLKKYFHLGFAADTPNGLTVPVIRDCDQKGVLALAQECGKLAAKARDGKLMPAEMQGGCFSISSLGGIGGSFFTPIINAPEVAILGVSRSRQQPVWDGKAFVPRLMLPLSLSYDHRVIDGAAAARFITSLSQSLADMRRVIL